MMCLGSCCRYRVGNFGSFVFVFGSVCFDRVGLGFVQSGVLLLVGAG